MKNETLELIKTHLDNGEIIFNDDSPTVSLFLTKTELRNIILTEYNKAPKRNRKIKDKIKLLMDEVLRIVVKHIKEETNA